MKNKLLLTFTLLFLLAACTSNDQSHQPQDTASQSENQNSPSYSAEDLRNAALEGNLESIRQIVDTGVDVEEVDQLGRTALMFASYNGHTKVVHFLIEQGADVQKQNSEGRTSLMFASSGPFPATVELLLENGSDPNAKDSVEGWTPLMYAAAEGNIEVVEVLLDYNADGSIQDTDGETAADFARNNGHADVVALLEAM
jgi:ankyrin repeat protein